MNHEQARGVLLTATREDFGTFTILRLGRDPGTVRVQELRFALRVLWRHWRTQDRLPFDIVGSAAVILNFRDEAGRNLARSGVIRERLQAVELPDLVQGAFDLLSGVEADAWIVPRPDLGE